MKKKYIVLISIVVVVIVGITIIGIAVLNNQQTIVDEVVNEVVASVSNEDLDADLEEYLDENRGALPDEYLTHLQEEFPSVDTDQIAEYFQKYSDELLKELEYLPVSYSIITGGDLYKVNFLATPQMYQFSNVILALNTLIDDPSNTEALQVISDNINLGDLSASEGAQALIDNIGSEMITELASEEYITEPVSSDIEILVKDYTEKDYEKAFEQVVPYLTN